MLVRRLFLKTLMLLPFVPSLYSKSISYRDFWDEYIRPVRIAQKHFIKSDAKVGDILFCSMTTDRVDGDVSRILDNGPFVFTYRKHGCYKPDGHLGVCHQWKCILTEEHLECQRRKTPPEYVLTGHPYNNRGPDDA